MLPLPIASLLVGLSVLHQLAWCVPQSAPTLAAVTAAPDDTSCDSCYVVADIAYIVFYSEVLTHTAATASIFIGAGSGNNGTIGSRNVTSTSIIENSAQITYNPSVTFAAQSLIGLTQVDYSSVITMNGVTLTSPTAYDVVTAYSVTSTFLSNGFCTTSSTISILPTAISTIVPSASGQLVISPEEEEYFINQLGFSSCSGAIESVTPMAHIQISNLTVSSTKFVSRVTAAAAVTTGAATSSSSTSSAPTSSSSPSPSASSTLSTASSTISSSSSPTSSVPVSVVFVSNDTVVSFTAPPKIVIGSLTVTPASISAPLTIGNTIITANAAGAYIFPSETLTPNGTVTIAESPSANVSLGGVLPFTSGTNDLRKVPVDLLIIWGVSILSITLTTFIL